MNYLFGPVNSRRLGLSQGLDLIPQGICNFNCIYCEVHLRKTQTCRRQEYSPTAAVLRELVELFADRKKVADLDVFTITASGEPTLHSGLGTIVRWIKEHTDTPVTVLTNGGLLGLSEVQRDLAAADIVIPSLDAARQQSFCRINRPGTGTDIATVIEGIIDFRHSFPGEIWLEILLAQDVNDSPEDLDALEKWLPVIDPEKIQLNTVVRPPLESFARPVNQQFLLTCQNRFGPKTEIIARYNEKKNISFRKRDQSDILELLTRRPGTTADLCQSLQCSEKDIQPLLVHLAQQKKIRETSHADERYWTLSRKE